MGGAVRRTVRRSAATPEGTLIAIRFDPLAQYPAPGSGFSPAAAYPEYRGGRLSDRPNAVYEMVRALLRDAGLDAARMGTPEWNPLGAHLAPGASVFVLCNFVYHMRPQDSAASLRAKCIHGSVLRALVDYILLAVGPGGRVTFGNAPLQSCRWDDVLEATGAAHVLDFYRATGAPVDARDLRLHVSHRDRLGRVVSVESRDAAGTDAVEVGLGDESLLAPLAAAHPRFRVSDYDPRRTEAYHANGAHRYVMHRAILDADAVISLSKLKTHEKVGITCGLKGFVGAVGHKDCLAHHRYGGRSLGGDEFRNDWAVLNGLARFHDWLNTREGDRPLQGASQVLERGVRRMLRRAGIPLGGAWYGNDTCWRMALDLARIVHYADRRGRMTTMPQRTHLSVIDGIVAGEGNGPLTPSPVDARVLLFADNVALGDRAACRLMGYDPASIPLVARALEPSRYPLVGAPDTEAAVRVNGELLDADRIRAFLGRPFTSPMGRGRD